MCKSDYLYVHSIVMSNVTPRCYSITLNVSCYTVSCMVDALYLCFLFYITSSTITIAFIRLHLITNVCFSIYLFMI